MDDDVHHERLGCTIMYKAQWTCLKSMINERESFEFLSLYKLYNDPAREQKDIASACTHVQFLRSFMFLSISIVCHTLYVGSRQ